MKIAALRCLAPLIFPLPVALLILAAAIDAASSDGSRIGSGAQGESPTALMGGWHFLRTRNPNGGTDAISIMHTADTSRSDLDLAGLMIRCSEHGTEAVIVLVRAFPIGTRLHVVFGEPGNETKFEATVASPGTSILITGNATSLVNSSWRAQSDLFMRIEDLDGTIRGVVGLAGLQTAFQTLASSCSAQ